MKRLSNEEFRRLAAKLHEAADRIETWEHRRHEVTLQVKHIPLAVFQMGHEVNVPLHDGHITGVSDVDINLTVRPEQRNWAHGYRNNRTSWIEKSHPESSLKHRE